MDPEEARQAVVSTEVAADMERIFGGAGRRAAPAGAASWRESRPGPARGFGIAGIARMAAPIAVVIAIGIVFAFALMPRDMVTARSAGADRPAPVRVAAAPVAVMAPVPAPVAVQAPPPAEPVAARPAPVPASPVDTPIRRVAAHRASAMSDCEASRDPDRCLYRQVRGADDRLRRAYHRAERADVSYREMVRVRRQWDHALARSLDEPEQTIRTYDRLALQLDRARLGNDE